MDGFIGITAKLAVLALVLMLAQPAQSEDQSPLLLADLVREAKIALAQVADTADAQNLPKLETAVLETKSTLKRGADGRISFYIVEFGATGTGEYASSLTLTLKPPPPGTPSNVAAAHLADALRDAILAGARAIKVAGEGTPPLIATKLVAVVNFVITRDGSGKLAVKFPPIEASGGGTISWAQVQTITVTYAR